MNIIQKKAFFSNINDGISEIFQGILLTLVGFMVVNIYTEIIIAVIIVLAGIGWLRISKKVKAKYIYPRIGYVKLHANHNRIMKRYRILFGVIVALSVVVFYISVLMAGWSVDTSLTFFPIIVGGIILGKFNYFFLFSGKMHYLIFGVSSLLLAFLFAFLPFSSGNKHIMYYAWVEALILSIWGILKLSNFLRKNPIQQEIDQS